MALNCGHTSLQAMPANNLPKGKLYKNGWIDHNKNGVKDIYEDPARPVEERIADLIARMTPEEKAAQICCPLGWPMYEKTGKNKVTI